MASHELHVESPAFVANGAIPIEFTADGADTSPPLAWSQPPLDTESVAILVEDPDAPAGPFTHWIVTGIPPEVTSIAPGGRLPHGAMIGANDFGEHRWRGPKPPRGRHHYHFKVYALDLPLARASLDREHLLALIAGHVLAQGEVVGTYEHKKR
jgi:Raf kinase inhibitor-like YbhB/YbcL family protein